MIIKLKPFNQLKIGLCGFRSEHLNAALEQYNASYTHIPEVEGITSDYDIVFVSGIYKLIKKPQLESPTYGVFGIHESPLPEGKGHAPIQWAVLNQRKNLTLTLFKFTEGMDAGPIVCQYNVPIDQMDTYPTIEENRKKGLGECLKICLGEMADGYLVLREQQGADSYSPKRSPKSSELDATRPLGELWDNIRICNNEKFPPFFIHNGKKIILRYEIVPYDNQ